MNEAIKNWLSEQEQDRLETAKATRQEVLEHCGLATEKIYLDEGADHSNAVYDGQRYYIEREREVTDEEYAAICQSLMKTQQVQRDSVLSKRLLKSGNGKSVTAGETVFIIMAVINFIAAIVFIGLAADSYRMEEVYYILAAACALMGVQYIGIVSVIGNAMNRLDQIIHNTRK